jgi:hypothetical protein
MRVEVEERVGHTGKVGRLHADEIALDAITQPHGGLARDVLAQQVVFHALERLGQVLLGERLAADDIAEETPNSTEARPDDTA